MLSNVILTARTVSDHQTINNPCNSFSLSKTKDLASRYERSLQESEAALEKIRTRHDSTADELQRFLLSKEGESTTAGMSNPGNTGKSSGGKNRLIGKTVAKGGMLLKGKNPANVSFTSYCCVRDAFQGTYEIVSATTARGGYQGKDVFRC